MDPSQAEGLQELSVAHDPQAVRQVAEERGGVAGACLPHIAIRGKSAGDRDNPMLVGSYHRIVLATGRPCRPLRRGPLGESDASLERRIMAQNTVEPILAGPSNPTHRRRNRGHRGFGKHRWDDMLQKVAGEQRGETPGWDEATDRERWRELGPIFI